MQGTRLDDREWYLTGFDEVFLSFGRHVGSNVFNQNRIAGGFSYQFFADFQIELCYLNQITQHAESDPRTELPVFEFNHGFRLGVVYNFKLLK